jgi:hypothetical protein
VTFALGSRNGSAPFVHPRHDDGGYLLSDMAGEVFGKIAKSKALREIVSLGTAVVLKSLASLSPLARKWMKRHGLRGLRMSFTVGCEAFFERAKSTRILAGV